MLSPGHEGALEVHRTGAGSPRTSIDGKHCPFWAKTLSPPSSRDVDSVPKGSYGVKHEIEGSEECPNGSLGVNKQQSDGLSSFQYDNSVLVNWFPVTGLRHFVIEYTVVVDLLKRRLWGIQNPDSFSCVEDSSPEIGGNRDDSQTSRGLPRSEISFTFFTTLPTFR